LAVTLRNNAPSPQTGMSPRLVRSFVRAGRRHYEGFVVARCDQRRRMRRPQAEAARLLAHVLQMVGDATRHALGARENSRWRQKCGEWLRRIGWDLSRSAQGRCRPPQPEDTLFSVAPSTSPATCSQPLKQKGATRAPRVLAGVGTLGAVPVSYLHVGMWSGVRCGNRIRPSLEAFQHAISAHTVHGERATNICQHDIATALMASNARLGGLHRCASLCCGSLVVSGERAPNKAVFVKIDLRRFGSLKRHARPIKRKAQIIHKLSL